MRHILITTTALLIGLCAAAPAMAQVDRYGGRGRSMPRPPVPQPQSSRVLNWYGQDHPRSQSPPQAGGYGYPRYVQARPAYGSPAAARALRPEPRRALGALTPSTGARPCTPQAQPPHDALRRRPSIRTRAPASAQMAPPQQPQTLARLCRADAAACSSPIMRPVPQPQQARPSRRSRPRPPSPSPTQPQPCFAPAPGAPMAAPGSTATAPSGVYPTNTVPPQLAGPGSAAAPGLAAAGEQSAARRQPPPPPTSIYAPPPQARIGDGCRPCATPSRTRPTPRQPQRVATMSRAASRRPPATIPCTASSACSPIPRLRRASDAGSQSVELVSSIDSGVGGEPATEPRNRIVRTNNKSGTAILRGLRAIPTPTTTRSRNADLLQARRADRPGPGAVERAAVASCCGRSPTCSSRSPDRMARRRWPCSTGCSGRPGRRDGGSRPRRAVRPGRRGRSDPARPGLATSPTTTPSPWPPRSWPARPPCPRPTCWRWPGTAAEAHLRAISGRRDLSEAVSDTVVQRADDVTLGLLLSNPQVPAVAAGARGGGRPRRRQSGAAPGGDRPPDACRSTC